MGWAIRKLEQLRVETAATYTVSAVLTLWIGFFQTPPATAFVAGSVTAPLVVAVDRTLDWSTVSNRRTGLIVVAVTVAVQFWNPLDRIAEQFAVTQASVEGFALSFLWAACLTIVAIDLRSVLD